MKTSVADYLKDRPKVYRLGLMGLSGAGKSCILAALGAYRQPNPKGITVIRLPDLPGVVAGRNRKPDDPVQAFYDGAHWLREAEAAIADGRPVRATEPGARLLALYQFTIPGRGAVWVEVVDYSGELLTLTNDALTVNLRRHLERLDGLLILAQAPAVGDKSDQLPAELQALRTALQTLSGELKGGSKWAVPIALLFNKWDRRSVPATEEEGRQAVAQLLGESEAHRCLHVELTNTVNGDGVRAFPVSAFGPSELHQSTEGPAHERPICRSPLQSFGLEDPFAWVVDQRDRIDWRRFGANGAKARPAQFWRVWQTWRTKAQGDDLVRRYSPEQKEGKDAEAAASRVRRAFRWQASICVLLTAMVGMAGLSAVETWHDHTKYAQVRTALDAGTSDSKRLEESQAWLTAYADSGWHRHLASSLVVVSADQARKDLAECQEHSAAWAAKVRANHDDVAGMEVDVGVLLAGIRLERVEKALAHARTLPRFPEADNADLSSRRDAVRDRLTAHQLKLQQMHANKEDRKTLDEYNSLLKAQNVAAAARLAEGARGEIGDKIRSD